ncbi:MAG: outer membrane protein transport protein, partial [Myxococcales bacterium]|nr:outer membrane protein transport protein [Myxococcales bacterium]
TGPEAAHHNAAGIALGDHPALMVGWGAGTMQLDIDGHDAELLDPHGASIGIAVPVALGGGWTVAGGLALYLPDQFLARVQLIPTTEPHYVLLDNDPHRVVVEPVAALAYGDRFAIGAGASVLADARSNQIVFDVGVVAGEKVGEAQLDIELPMRLAPILGVWARPSDRVRLGATFRGELSLDLVLDILANVQVVGVVTGDALVSLRASNYFTPARGTAAAAVDVTPDLTIEGDVTWSHWSSFDAGVADLQVLVALDITPPLVSSQTPAPGFHDTFSGRAGVEWRGGGRRTRWALRGGWGWLPTPVPAQTGLTSFADGDRMLVTLGAGVTLADWAPILTRPIDVDVGLQWQHVAHQLTQKDVDLYPGQAFSSGGDILHAGVSTTIRF